MTSDRDQRTEQPTTARRRRAREAGEVARSRDLVAAVSLLAVLGALDLFGGAWLRGADAEFRGLLHDAFRAGPLDVAGASTTLASAGGFLVRLLVPAALVVVAAVAIVSLAQTGFLFRPSNILPAWGRLSPAGRGGGGVLPSGSCGRGALALAKCAWLVVVAAQGLAPVVTGGLATTVYGTVDTTGDSLTAGLASGAGHLLSVASIAVWGLVALGFVDWCLRKWQLERRLMMTRREVIDEHSEQEAPPEVRRQRRRLAKGLVPQGGAA